MRNPLSAPSKISSKASDLPGISQIEAAAGRIAGVAVQTPLLESPLLNRRLGGRIFIKPEMLQRTGSFKFRGAYNRISQLSADERRRGVVAFSSGNHAQGVAHAAELLGVPAVIVMPKDAPAIKVANTRSYGAEVVLYDREKEDREAIGRAIAEERGSILVPPYDDPHIIAGQGTVGLEIAQQMQSLGLVPDQVATGASGGGLIAGVSTAIKAYFAGCRVYVAEPEGFTDHGLSLARGERTANPAPARSFCDALLAPMPGEITFAINSRTLAGAVSATDLEVEEAIRVCFSDLKLVAEPGGAVALAAALNGTLDCRERISVLILSGGNVDPELFRDILDRRA
ncbi:MAG: threonine/serine dehydratase [Alphaproteobacteria bacterium]|nr:threonine/serine dehydratase [Alphaproteobacteria bacterium]